MIVSSDFYHLILPYKLYLRSSLTPNLSFTTFCITDIKWVTSPQVALSKFTTKPQCFSETPAPPYLSPRGLHHLLIFQQNSLEPFKEVLPPLGNSNGCLDVLFES